MLRRVSLSIIFSLSLNTLAQATEMAETLPPEVLPVARSSNGVFDILGPLIDAKAYFEAGQFEDSYKNYSAVLLHDPDNIDVLFGLAASALALEKGTIAEKAYIKLAKYDLTTEQSIDRFSGLVLSETISGRSENPETRLKQALNISPEDFRLWNALGQHYDKEARWRESWKAYQKARATGFSEAGLHNNLGMSFLAQKKYKGAVSHFNYAKKLAPSHIQFENNHRFALLMQGDYKMALENIDDDQAGILLSDAGYIAIQREEFILARMLLEKAIDVSPRYNQRAASNLVKLEARQN